MAMTPPLQYHPSTFVQAAKDISRAAWNISEVAVNLLSHQEAASTQEIKSALAAALAVRKTELLRVHGEAERVSWSVQTAAGVFWNTDRRYGALVEDGRDYDTRHDRHPFVFGPPFIVPNPKLPGE
jgi:hypothetical protein